MPPRPSRRSSRYFSAITSPIAGSSYDTRKLRDAHLTPLRSVGTPEGTGIGARRACAGYHRRMMGSEPADGSSAADGASTWKKPASTPAPVRTRVPCLTVCAHAELSRIGERALLSGLLVRSAIGFSRAELGFAHPGAKAGRTLEDPYLSRSKVVLSGDPRRELIVRYSGDDLRIDGLAI